MNPPPLPSPLPLPTGSTSSFFHHAARASWLSVPLAVLMNIVLTASNSGVKSRELSLIQGGLGALLMLLGLVCGIIALCGLRQHGTKGLLWPALTGIMLWLLLIAIALPNFLHARKKALEMRAALARRVVLAPVVQTAGAERVQDSELGFVFELPAGYQPVPAKSKLKDYRYAFLKPGVEEANSAVMVKGMGGTIRPNQHLSAAQIPADKNITLTTVSWRGLDVDAIRVPEKTPAGDYVTLNVQIPLKKQAIQISFGGPAASELLLKTRAEQVLTTLDGEINW